MGQHFHRVQGAREKQIKRRMVKFRAGEVELPWLLKGFTVLQLKRLLDGGTAPDTAFPHTFLMSGFGTVWDTLGCTHLAQLLSTVSEHDCPPAGLHSYCSAPTSLSTGTSTNMRLYAIIKRPLVYKKRGRSTVKNTEYVTIHSVTEIHHL